MNELITIEQLPIITEHLENVKEDVLKRVEYAKTCACTIDTVKEVKKYRADLRKDFELFEAQRKGVETAVLKPYNDFKDKYKECIVNVFKDADSTLKEKINDVENGLKAEKEKAVREYFEEYKTANRIIWPEFERANISITLSASEKKLKEEAKAFIDRVLSDLSVIYMQDEDMQDEILVEYRKSLNLQDSIQITVNRHKQLEAMKAAQEERQKQLEEEKKHIETVEQTAKLAAPKISEPEPEAEAEQEKLYSAVFKVVGTLEELKAVKLFLEERGIKYEC